MIDTTYDAIVIGSGLAGLSAAAAIADGGLNVLLLEQAREVGGLAHSFQRGPYTFDPQSTTRGRHARARRWTRCSASRRARSRQGDSDGFFLRGRFSGGPVRLPTDPLDFIDVVTEQFPDEAGAIREFLRLCAQLHEEAHELPTQVSFAELDAVANQFPTLFEYQRSTAGEVIDRDLRDPRLRALGWRGPRSASRRHACRSSISRNT